MIDLKKLKEDLSTLDENERITYNGPLPDESLQALRQYALKWHSVQMSSEAATRLVTELEELRAYRKALPIETALELVSNLIGVAGAVRRGLASGQLEKVEDARRYLLDVPE